MRLFTALDLPPDLVRKLEDFPLRLPPAPDIHWSPAANLHITTKFIGEWPESRLAELKRVLAAMPPAPPVPVRIRRVAFFPIAPAPRVFVCGVEAPGLPELAAATGAAAASLGIPAETRPYSPHLTLARIRGQAHVQALGVAIAALASLEIGRFEARSFFLYQSVLQSSGSVYTKLAEFPLTKS